MKKKQGQEQYRTQVDYVNWIVSTGTVWTVLCQGLPMHIRKEHSLRTETKYLHTQFSQRGSAQRLAKKLNAMFDTTDFTAVAITAKTPQ